MVVVIFHVRVNANKFECISAISSLALTTPNHSNSQQQGLLDFDGLGTV